MFHIGLDCSSHSKFLHNVKVNPHHHQQVSLNIYYSWKIVVFFLSREFLLDPIVFRWVELHNPLHATLYLCKDVFQ